MQILYDPAAAVVLQELLESTRSTTRFAEAMDAIEAEIRRDGLKSKHEVVEGLYSYRSDILSFTVIREHDDAVVVGVAYASL